MSIKTYKPTTPSRRHMSVSGFDGVDKHAKPQKELVEVLKKNSGRNSYGRITVRHQGGGNRQEVPRYRLQARQDGRARHCPAPGVRPNRSAYIALVEYPDGERRYILAPVGLKVGHIVLSSAAADIKPGNALPLANIPGRYRYPQHRALPRQGCPAGPLRGRRRPADGQGKRYGNRPPPLRRVPQGPP